MLLEYIFLLLSAIAFAFPLCAQMPEQDNYVVSPSQAALGEYGNVPVSLYTGIPEVCVPVYTAQVGSHKIPIVLSYHGGGVQPDRHPGWVGMTLTQ